MSIKQKNKGNITKPCFLTLIRITMVLLSSAILVRYMKVYPRFGKRKQSVIFTCFVDLYIQTVFSKVVDTRLRAQWFCGVSPQLYSTLIFNVSFSLWFILFLGEFSKMAAVYLHRPPYPLRGESLSPCRLLGGGGEGWLGLRDGWHLRLQENDDLFSFLFQGDWNFVKLSRILRCFQM